MDIIQRIDRTIKSNDNCIQHLLEEYTISVMATAYKVHWDEALMAIQKLQIANNELVILRANIESDRQTYANSKQKPKISI